MLCKPCWNIHKPQRGDCDTYADAVKGLLLSRSATTQAGGTVTGTKATTGTGKATDSDAKATKPQAASGTDATTMSAATASGNHVDSDASMLTHSEPESGTSTKDASMLTHSEPESGTTSTTGNRDAQAAATASGTTTTVTATGRGTAIEAVQADLDLDAPSRATTETRTDNTLPVSQAGTVTGMPASIISTVSVTTDATIVTVTGGGDHDASACTSTSGAIGAAGTQAATIPVVSIAVGGTPRLPGQATVTTELEARATGDAAATTGIPPDNPGPEAATTTVTGTASEATRDDSDFTHVLDAPGRATTTTDATIVTGGDASTVLAAGTATTITGTDGGHASGGRGGRGSRGSRGSRGASGRGGHGGRGDNSTTGSNIGESGTSASMDLDPSDMPFLFAQIDELIELWAGFPDSETAEMLIESADGMLESTDIEYTSNQMCSLEHLKRLVLRAAVDLDSAESVHSKPPSQAAVQCCIKECCDAAVLSCVQCEGLWFCSDLHHSHEAHSNLTLKEELSRAGLSMALPDRLLPLQERNHAAVVQLEIDGSLSVSGPDSDLASSTNIAISTEDVFVLVLAIGDAKSDVARANYWAQQAAISGSQLSKLAGLKAFDGSKRIKVVGVSDTSNFDVKGKTFSHICADFSKVTDSATRGVKTMYDSCVFRYGRLPDVVCLDYFWLQRGYYTHRYGKMWVEHAIFALSEYPLTKKVIGFNVMVLFALCN